LDQDIVDDLLLEKEITGDATCADIAKLLVDDFKVESSKEFLTELIVDIDKRFLELFNAGMMARYVPAVSKKDKKYGKVRSIS
jgi:hypothetical protein